MSILDLGTGDDQVRKLETRVFTGRVDNGSFRVEIHKIGVERGVSWEEAMELHKEHSNDDVSCWIGEIQKILVFRTVSTFVIPAVPTQRTLRKLLRWFMESERFEWTMVLVFMQ